MTATWLVVLVATAGCYAFKLAGHSLPESVLDRPLVRRSRNRCRSRCCAPWS